MICPKCKQEISDDTKFCGNCGNKINLNNNAKPKLKLTKYKIFLITMGILILLLVGFNVYALNKNKAANPTETKEIAASTSAKSNDSETPLENEAKAKFKEFYVNKYHKDVGIDNWSFYNCTIKKGGVIGADELIGKICFAIGGKGGNHTQFYINTENWAVYEVVTTVPIDSVVADVLVTGDADKATIAKAQLDAEDIRHKQNNSSTTTANSNTSTKISKTTLLGHWISNDSNNAWYSEKLLFEKGQKGGLETYTYWTVSDNSEVKNQILEPYKTGYIYSSHSQGTIDKTPYNFTDDIINNNSIIIKSNLPDGTVYTELAVLGNDRKSYKTYQLTDTNSIFDLGTVYYFVDSQQHP